MADEELPDETEAPETLPVRQGGGPKPPKSAGSDTSRPGAPKPPGGPGFFTIYKRGQGYWTRMGTAIGAAFLGIMFSFELYNQVPTFLHGDAKHDQRVALIVAVVFLIGYAIWAWWFTNRPKSVDFLVATDSEMKKVNWTTKQELIGATKIVIGFMFFVAIFLFACDLLFGGFFHVVGVLKTWF